MSENRYVLCRNCENAFLMYLECCLNDDENSAIAVFVSIGCISAVVEFFI